METIKKQKANIEDDDNVLYIVTNKHITYRKNGFTAHKANIVKISKNTFINKNTGELIKNVNNSKLKIENQQSLIRSFRNLFYTIEDNVTGSKYDLMLTLTYSEAQTNFKELSHDFEKFIKRLRRYLDKQYTKPKIKFIRINEPHEDLENGQVKWHIHLIIVGVPFISNTDLEKVWGLGKTYVTSYENRDPRDIAMYFAGFLNAPEYTDKTDQLSLKRSSKKRRLKYYKTGIDLFSCSREIKVPTFRHGKFKNIKKRYPGTTINQGAIILKKDGKIINRFDYINQKLIY